MGSQNLILGTDTLRALTQPEGQKGGLYTVEFRPHHKPWERESFGQLEFPIGTRGTYDTANDVLELPFRSQ